MEADVFPVAARLVARPDARIALRACPAVQADDEGTGIVAIVGHDLCHVGDAVQSEGVSGTYPGYVRLEHTHTGVAHFLHDVALQQRLHTFLRMEIGLRPKTDFHAILAGIVRQSLQILYITVQATGLSITGTIAVVRQEPTQRHVVRLVTVDDGAGRELVVLLLAVQRFLDASIVFLTFLVTLAVLKEDAFLVFFPVVAVVGVQVAFVETELG